jgi:hypothetical protein
MVIKAAEEPYQAEVVILHPVYRSRVIRAFVEFNPDVEINLVSKRLNIYMGRTTVEQELPDTTTDLDLLDSMSPNADQGDLENLLQPVDPDAISAISPSQGTDSAIDHQGASGSPAEVRLNANDGAKTSYIWYPTDTLAFCKSAKHFRCKLLPEIRSEFTEVAGFAERPEVDIIFSRETGVKVGIFADEDGYQRRSIRKSLKLLAYQLFTGRIHSWDLDRQP